MPYPSGLFNPTEDINIERVLDGLSTALEQSPTGLGEANQVQIEFGVAVNDSTDPVNLLQDGTLVINKDGLYRLKISLLYGREVGGGTSELRFRVLINGVQAGQTVGVDIDSAKISLPFEDEAWVNLTTGLLITYEIMRESSGADTGGLISVPVTSATAPSWAQTTCAAIRVERWV
tara:strand:- start:7810 stop:8337 length:528 start_codon:yes stop_codon:yes gene_type:complete